MRSLISILLLCAASACTCIPSQASCDSRPKGGATCTDLLENRHSHFANTLEALCGGGAFSTSSLCDRSGSLGGCLCEGCENGRSITWFFASADAGVTSAADVMQKCSEVSRTYESP